MVVVSERGRGVEVAAVWGEGVVPAVWRGAGRRSMDCRESGGAVDGSGGGEGVVVRAAVWGGGVVLATL